MVATNVVIYENLVAFLLPNGGLTNEQFFEFCQINRQLRIERSGEGQIVIMPPTGSLTGSYNSEFTIELGIWNRKHKLGRTFDSSTGFKLPSGADYSPDASWVSNEKWNALTKEEKLRFAPVVPEFIAEIRSPNDNLNYLKDKMEEFIAFGTRLAWLIDPQKRRTIVYQEDGEIHTFPFEHTLEGGAVLPGFSVNLEAIFVE